MMRLSSLLSALPEALSAVEWRRQNASHDPTIRGLRYDSRKVSPGDLFVRCKEIAEGEFKQARIHS